MIRDKTNDWDARHSGFAITQTEPGKFAALPPAEDPREGWKWWAGVDQETYQLGPFETRDEAIDAGQHYSMGERQCADQSWALAFFIVEARQEPQRMSAYIDDGDIEMLAGRADEAFSESDLAGEFDDGPFFEFDDKALADLDVRIRKAMDEWQDHHNLVFRPRMFTDSRNEEAIVIPLKEEA